MRKLARRRVSGEDRQVEVLYPSMYFGVERQRRTDGSLVDNTSYAVNNIYLDGVRIAAVIPSGDARYYLTDQVDSVKVVADDKGLPVSRMEYMPYGETWFEEGDTNNAPKYNSQELDKESNFYYYNARHYSQDIARFVTADTVIDGEMDTQGWNRYAYCHNNPIRYKDPSGHWHEGLGDWMKEFLANTDNEMKDKKPSSKDETPKKTVEDKAQKNKAGQDRTISSSPGKAPNSVFSALEGNGNNSYKNDLTNWTAVLNVENALNFDRKRPKPANKDDNIIKQITQEGKIIGYDAKQKLKKFKNENPTLSEDAKAVGKALLDVEKGVVKGKKPEIRPTVLKVSHELYSLPTEHREKSSEEVKKAWEEAIIRKK